MVRLLLTTRKFCDIIRIVKIISQYETTNKKTVTASSNYVQSLDRALSILDVLAEGGESGIPLTRIAASVGINSSTARHLLATLVARQVVEQDPISRRYRLGVHLIELGNSARSSTSLVRLAYPYVEGLWETTGEAVSLLVFHGLLRTVLLGLQSRQMLHAQSAPLTTHTLHATGSGKVLLAYLPERELQEYLNRATLSRFTNATITDPDALREELARVRATGVALDCEEHGVGVRCIAAPIKDAHLRVIGCLDVVFTTFGLAEERFQQMIAATRQNAIDLSVQLHDIGLVIS
jgi:DNA-binding IclR family transcriptional regulator